MKRLWILFLLSIFLNSKALGEKKYVSPIGNEVNSGNTQNSPWSLSYALSGSAPLYAGDSLILLDGVYEGNFVSDINGTAEKPIYILPENENKAIIDVSKNRTSGTGLTIRGSYTWIIGIHVTSSSLIRKSEASNGFSEVPYESGIAVFGDNNKIINCWIYDVVGGGLELWRSGLNVEVYGSVIFNNGSQSDTRGTGHGMYIQHDQPDQPKLIENNVIFQNASQGINIYTTNPENKGIKIFRNVSFNTGIIATFNPFLFRPPHNLSIGSQSNLSSDMEVGFNLFYSDLQGQRLSTNDISNVTIGRTFSPNQNISFYNNILFGGRNVLEFLPLEGLHFQENRLINPHGNFFSFLGNNNSFPNSNWDSNAYSNIANFPKPFQDLSFQEWKDEYAPFDINSQYSISPSSLREVLITQNKYDPSRFFVSVLNFTDANAVNLDFSNYPEMIGAEYEIRDLQNPFDSDQKSSGTFQGNEIMFPMNWTKSLQPKGNMPFQAVHTDLTFGTFLLVFKKNEEDLVNFPEVKDSVALFLNTEGIALLSSQDFLVEQPSEPFTYSSSQGFDFNCSNLGKNEVSITLKNTRTGEEQTKNIVVWVFDDLAPMFDAANATYLFDPVVGKVSISLADFDIVDFKDNCDTNLTISLSKSEITCSDIFLNPQVPVWEFPIEITATDASGNSFSKTVKAIIGNIIESKKVSITSLDPLTDDGASTLRLGNELEYEVLEWTRNGVVIPDQKGKEVKVNSQGRYQAKLLLSSGCSVDSSPIIFESPDLPSEYKEDVTLILNENGKATLTSTDIFGENDDIANEVVLSQSEFDCTNLGSQNVRITLNYQSTPINPNLSYSEEFWIKVLIKDKTVPVFEEKFTPVDYDFDLSVGELDLNPLDFFTSKPQDNCGSDGIVIQPSLSKITCADIDPERYSYIVTFDISVSDPSGNSRTFPAAANLKIIESKKISISPESGTEFLEGNAAEIRLGEEFGFTLVGWYRNGQLIEGEKGKAILTEEPGTYWATLFANDEGCIVESKKTEIKFIPSPFGEVKESITLVLGAEGKADLGPSDVFVTWPLPDPTLEITLSKSIFNCEDIGEKEVAILIKNQTGQTWEKSIKVIIKDQTAPVLVPKNLTLELDVTKGFVEITPEQVLAEFGDNCAIKSLTINKNIFTCEDIGKEFTVAIRAEDNSGNVKEAVSIVKIERMETDPVALTGSSSFCAGESGVLELTSLAAFEVVRWRRNGVEIQGQTEKSLEVTESGVYHAVIRYEGGCLSESEEFEVKVNALPEGEIEVDGNILRAPDGDFTYQWFRNGEKLENETSRTFTAQLMGEYHVELTSEAGCRAYLETVTLTISGLLNRPVMVAKDLKIYPNPASDRVILEFPDGVLVSKPSLSLYSSEGKNVTNAVQISILNDTEVEILLNRLAKGTYLVWAIGQNQETYFGKLVILN